LSRDSRGRTLAKTAVYRLVAVALLGGITFYYTGNAGEATTITIIFNVLGTIAYYGLERLWEYVLWGRGDAGSPVSLRVSKPLAPLSGDARASALPGSRETDSEVNREK
jgi:uncharacterized membrane protein